MPAAHRIAASLFGGSRRSENQKSFPIVSDRRLIPLAHSLFGIDRQSERHTSQFMQDFPYRCAVNTSWAAHFVWVVGVVVWV